MADPRTVGAAIRRFPRTVRGRSTLLSMLVVGLTLFVALAVVLLVYRAQLQANLDQTLQQQVDDRAALLDRGSNPNSLVNVSQDESLVWIGTPAGEVVAFAGEYVPIDQPVPAEVGTMTTRRLRFAEHELGEQDHEDDEDEEDEEEDDDHSDDVESREMRIASAATADGRLIVVAAAEVEVIGRSIGPLLRIFIGALPLLTLAVGAIVWVVVGRVLQPVDRIRSRAQDITGTSLDARVPVPETDDEIHELAVTMNSMLDRIESHDRSLREFTADASHELKSPIANLRALVDTARLDDPAWPDVRGRLVGESDRLRDLVDNLLFLASHESGAPRGRVAAVGLDEIVFDECEVLAATGRVTLDLGGIEPAQVTGVAADLVRLVRNLLDNAARHASGRVAVATMQRGDTVTLRVDDDGPGIPPADRRRIFERFTRLDEARARDAGGSGLGLAIVAQIVADHGATITVDNAPIGGARFEVVF